MRMALVGDMSRSGLDRVSTPAGATPGPALVLYTCPPPDRTIRHFPPRSSWLPTIIRGSSCRAVRRTGNASAASSPSM